MEQGRNVSVRVSLCVCGGCGVYVREFEQVEYNGSCMQGFREKFSTSVQN